MRHIYMPIYLILFTAVLFAQESPTLFLPPENGDGWRTAEAASAGLSAAEMEARIPALLEAVGLAVGPERDTLALSGGQVQRLAIARAILKDAPIVVLDEPTSQIDTETEAVIQYAIETLIAKRTSIIIAHRLSTIRHADQIMVLDKGEIREMGTHEELLRINNGFYKKLYDMQFADLQPAI